MLRNLLSLRDDAVRKLVSVPMGLWLVCLFWFAGVLALLAFRPTAEFGVAQVKFRS